MMYIALNLFVVLSFCNYGGCPDYAIITTTNSSSSLYLVNKAFLIQISDYCALPNEKYIYFSYLNAYEIFIFLYIMGLNSISSACVRNTLLNVC